jgi:hypothetical protein
MFASRNPVLFASVSVELPSNLTVPSFIFNPALPLPVALLVVVLTPPLRTSAAPAFPFELSFARPPCPAPDPPLIFRRPLTVSWGVPVEAKRSVGPELAAEPEPVNVSPAHWAPGISIVTVTPGVVIVTSSGGPGTTPPAHVPGLLQFPVAIASNPEARMFTAGEAAIGVSVPVPQRVDVLNTLPPPADGVERADSATLPGFASVTAAPKIVMVNGLPAEPSPVTDLVADTKPVPEIVTAFVSAQLHAEGNRTLAPVIVFVPSPWIDSVSATDAASTRRTPGAIVAVPVPSPGSNPKSVWLRGFSRKKPDA